ncbi:MAG: hypothetical protein KDA93_00170 [Planctomycetaceae bacterium]|nr:hypothetical protein [Planctomycetaceae bacterium]
MNEQTNDEQERGWLFWLVMLILLPTLYALSIGPALCFYEVVGLKNYFYARECFQLIYAPLGVVIHMTGTVEFVKGYAEWWTI